jgi:hypothetical protein
MDERCVLHTTSGFKDQSEQAIDVEASLNFLRASVAFAQPSLVAAAIRVMPAPSSLSPLSRQAPVNYAVLLYARTAEEYLLTLFFFYL